MTKEAAPGTIQALTSTYKHRQAVPSLNRFLPSLAAFDPTFPSDDAAAANDSPSSCTIERLADSYRLPLLSTVIATPSQALHPKPCSHCLLTTINGLSSSHDTLHITRYPRLDDIFSSNFIMTLQISKWLALFSILAMATAQIQPSNTSSHLPSTGSFELLASKLMSSMAEVVPLTDRAAGGSVVHIQLILQSKN